MMEEWNTKGLVKQGNLTGISATWDEVLRARFCDAVAAGWLASLGSL